eukprot:gene3032-3588_t
MQSETPLPHRATESAAEAREGEPPCGPPAPPMGSAARAPAAPRGIRVVARYPGVTFVHKPPGMATHPFHGRRYPGGGGGRGGGGGDSPGLMECPVCSRGFHSNKDVGAWSSVDRHLRNAGSEDHVAWRQANPGGLQSLQEQDPTLWHGLRSFPDLFQTPLPPDAPLPRPVPEPAAPHGGDDVPLRTIYFANRLDRSTSGLVCLAETPAMADALQQAWPEAQKTYLVMARGKAPAEFTVDRPLTDLTGEIKKAKGAGPVGKKPAVTSFKLVSYHAEEKLSLLRASLDVGGRTHQIRRHLNSVARQVVGDTKYGKSGITKCLADDYGLH